MTSASVSIHGLTAASLRYGVHVYEGDVGVSLDDFTQLHWPSLDALDAFVDRLGELAYEARKVATEKGAPVDSPTGKAVSADGSGSDAPGIGEVGDEGAPATSWIIRRAGGAFVGPFDRASAEHYRNPADELLAINDHGNVIDYAPQFDDGEGAPASDAPVCAASEDRGYICTLDSGHDGDHVAHGATDVVCATWPQTPIYACLATHQDDVDYVGDYVACSRERGHVGSHRADLADDEHAAWSDSTPGAWPDDPTVTVLFHGATA